jgi:hypothetical protein
MTLSLFRLYKFFKLQIFLFSLELLKLISFLPIIFLVFSLFLCLTDSAIVFCMDDCLDCNKLEPAAASTSKYTICDVKYDRSGDLIKNSKGDPVVFCNKHDSQISAMYDRAMSAVEKQQHQDPKASLVTGKKIIS